MIAASAAVLVALFVLLRSITSAPPPTPAPTSHPADPPPASSAAPSVPALSRHEGSSSGGNSLAKMFRPHKRPATGEAAPSASASDDRTPEERGDGPPATRYNTKNLQYGLPQLRDKIAGNTPQVAACIGGARPTGKATMTFIVAHRGGTYVVEQSDYDRDASTVQDETMLDCFAKAATNMQFDGLPREADAIIVTRTIELDNGAVKSDRPSNFSYIR
jgi:hypothetical protein